MHFQVAEKAMSLLCNEKLVELLKLNSESIFKKILKIIINATETHWNEYNKKKHKKYFNGYT